MALRILTQLSLMVTGILEVIMPVPREKVQSERYESCPKCQGQYLREGTRCHCYQCCFEWDLREPVGQVRQRAARRVRGALPDHPLLDDREARHPSDTCGIDNGLEATPAAKGEDGGQHLEIIGTQRGLNQRGKVAVLKERLGFLLREPDRTYPVNSREASDTGREYSDAAIDAGELMCALSRCSVRQRRILGLWLGRDSLTQEEISRLLRISVPTVKRDVADALGRMAQMVWED